MASLQAPENEFNDVRREHDNIRYGYGWAEAAEAT